MTEADLELAKVAYNAYGDSRNWVVFNGDPMPSWEDQRPELQDAWRAAAAAVHTALAWPGAQWTKNDAGHVSVKQMAPGAER